MFAVDREREPDKVAFQRRLFIAPQTLVWEVLQPIVAKIENRNGLPHPALLRPVSLIEQRRIAAVWTERDGGGVAVTASNEAGDWNSDRLAGRKMDFMRALVGARGHQDQANNGNCGSQDGVDRFHGR